MNLNQKGITLVELIAALAIVSIITAIAWTTLTIGFKHTAAETTKTKLQQEANLVITRITNEHRRNDYYSLRLNSGILEMNTCNDLSPTEIDCDGFFPLTENNYLYSGSVNSVSFVDLIETEKINTKTTHVDFTVKVADPVKPVRSVEIQTTLTRILTNLN